MKQERLAQILQQQCTQPRAAYAFGIRIQGYGSTYSAPGLAVLVEGHTESPSLWKLSGLVAKQTDCPLDLLDLRTASTIMRHQTMRYGLNRTVLTSRMREPQHACIK